MLPIHFHHDDERKRKRPQLVDNSGWKYRSSTATAAASTLFPALISPLRIEKTLIERSSKSFLFPKGRSLFYHNVISYCTLIYPPRIRARPIGPTRESAWLSLARSKGAESFIILIVPATPPQVFTLHPVPVLPRKGYLRLLDRTQAILSLH